MEAVGLKYIQDYRVIICLEHQHGLIPTGIEKHLRRSHAVKGSRLHAAVREVALLSPRLLSPIELPIIPHYSNRIPGIQVIDGFHCLLPDCNNERQSLSCHRRTVEKHQARVHAVNQSRPRNGRRKEGSHQSPYKIESVCMQSLMPKQHERPFIVRAQETTSQPTEAVPYLPSCAMTSLELEELDEIEKAVDVSEEAAHMQLTNDPPQSQLAPWLTRTGISNHIRSMGTDDIAALVRPPTEGKLLVFTLLSMTTD